ncbi:MAG: tetratricopeptide repeat protein [Bacteroidetes bacterium]|jgi:tetratricopeptide (TPR) repeat protein|nr:tetratricopeptide repeat protein [Bacteroidota bacterium]
MDNKRLYQIVVILAVSLLTLSLYLAGKNSSTGILQLSEGTMPNQESDWDFNMRSAIAMELEKDSVKSVVGALYPQDAERADPMTWMPQVAQAWDSLGHSLFAGYYFEQLAKHTGSVDYWYKAGFRFFNLVNLTSDTLARRELGAHALEALKATLVLDASNLKAKAELGVLYMELLPDGVTPMTGVGLLMEVLQEDSNHLEALYYMSYLSMKSGQYDKAVKRLKKLVSLVPLEAKYHEYLANAYLQAGKPDKALGSIRRYAELDGRPNAQKRADFFIKQLNNN